MEVLMGKSSINGLCSMAMLNNQRVRPPIYSGWYSDGISVTIRQRFTPPSAPWHARRWRCLFLRQKGYNGYNTRNGGSMEGSYISISFPGTVRLSRWWNGLKWCGSQHKQTSEPKKRRISCPMRPRSHTGSGRPQFTQQPAAMRGRCLDW